MELIISHYVPPKSACYGHKPRIKDLSKLVMLAQTVQDLFVTDQPTCSLVVDRIGGDGPVSQTWLKRLCQTFPTLPSPDGKVSDQSLECPVDPVTWPTQVQTLADMEPLPEYTELSINLIVTLFTRWRGADGNVHLGYHGLPGDHPHLYFSKLTFYLGNWPAVGTSLIYPVRHDQAEGLRLTAAFNDVGLVQLSDKHFKLMRYNPKSKKWSPVRGT